MKKHLLISLTLSFISLMCSAEVIEKWEFSEEDGTGLSAMLSDKGTAFSNKNKPSAKVSNGRLRFTAEGDHDSIFLTHEFAAPNPTDGIYEASWIFTSAAFPNTMEVKGRAFAGIDIRDTGETTYKGDDDKVIAGVRIGFHKGSIVVQYQDHEGAAYQEIAKVDRVVIPEPLNVRIRFDYSKVGKPGSMMIYLQMGDEDEINFISDGVLPEGVRLKGYRIIQQITNGGTNWKLGDYVTVDDFTLSRVLAE